MEQAEGVCVFQKKQKKQTDPQHSVLNILTKKRVLSLSKLLHRKGQNSKSRYHPSTMTLPTPGDPSAEAFTTDKPRRPSPVYQVITTAERKQFVFLSLHCPHHLALLLFCLPKTTTWWQVGETARPATIPVLRLT